MERHKGSEIIEREKKALVCPNHGLVQYQGVEGRLVSAVSCFNSSLRYGWHRHQLEFPECRDYKIIKV